MSVTLEKSTLGALTSQYLSNLVAANLRMVTGTEPDDNKDYPGDALRSIIEVETDQLEQIIAEQHQNSADAIALGMAEFLSFTANFMVDAAYVSLTAPPLEATEQVQILADQLKVDLADVLETVRRENLLLKSRK